ncbi:MAG: ATP-binding cassette domain-containing protein, partial [Peptostreptococcaceae bacterium]|nr:ATP-binding cassette domain-containing protein [Peptostreptococcaceae bacterium]
IAYPLKLRGWSSFDIEERINQLTIELGLEKLRKRKAWRLSGGEIQKVALARALSFRPGLLLLDEPTANIDPATTAEIERMLAKINKEEGTSIIIVTHNLPQAKRVCNKLIFLNKGKLIEEGNCREILKNPVNGLTRRFIEGELLV